MAKGKRRQTADNDQFEDEGAMRKELREMMYHKGAQQQHLRFVCNHKLLDEFWNKHRVEKITAFRKYEIDVIRIIRERFLRVLSIAIFTEWTDLIRFDPVFVKEDLDDSSLFFDERQLNGMVTGVDNFVAQQYMFKPEIIIQTQQAHIQAVPAISRLPFIDEPAILGKGGYGSVSRRQIAPYCLNSNSEEYGSTSNSGVSSVSHRNTYY